MKNKIKSIAAAVAATALLGTMSMSVSATTVDDVVAAARGAGFLEEYVQTLQNFLNTSHYTSSQYDTMIGMLSSAGDDMDEIAMQYFGKTVAQMKGEAQDEADKTGKPVDDSFLVDIVDQMKDEDVINIVNKIIETGKDLGLDITAEKKGDKNYIITVKDKDGNIQLVTPVGKLIDRTGYAENVSGTDEVNGAMAVSVAVTAAGCAGALALMLKLRKNEE